MRSIHLFESYGWKWENKPGNNWQGDYANYIKLGSIDIRTQPFYLLYGGYVAHVGSLNSVGAIEYYWSSTSRSPYSAYAPSLNSSALFPATSVGFSEGFSIRCLAR